MAAGVPVRQGHLAKLTRAKGTVFSVKSGNFLSALAAAAAVRDGSLSSRELVQSCLDRIEEFEVSIEAWAHLDAELALAQADETDRVRQAGKPLGALHGVPVGIKDIIDTRDLPTERGTSLYSGRTPSQDATVVALLREAGAIVLGKTVTTELAVHSPGKTRNPHDPKRTPGGSSSGSAAAVAAFMSPLAVGTQTNGSVIRPAAFCGTFGYKPTHGLVSRHGVLAQSQALDTVGMFARSLADLALLASVLMAYDSRDRDMRPRARPDIARIMAEEPPGAPRIAFVRSPVWGQAEETTKEALRELIEHVTERAGERFDVVDLPSLFDGAHDMHRTIMEADLARNFEQIYGETGDRLSADLRARIERGRQVLATTYNAALDRVAHLNHFLDELCHDYDAVLTPSVAGEAPVGLESTGDPTFCTIWTLCGTPALNLPLLKGPAGMPLGVQLVSQKWDDARLFRNARWLVEMTEE